MVGVAARRLNQADVIAGAQVVVHLLGIRDVCGWARMWKMPSRLAEPMSMGRGAMRRATSASSQPYVLTKNMQSQWPSTVFSHTCEAKVAVPHTGATIFTRSSAQPTHRSRRRRRRYR